MLLNAVIPSPSLSPSLPRLQLLLFLFLLLPGASHLLLLVGLQPHLVERRVDNVRARVVRELPAATGAGRRRAVRQGAVPHLLRDTDGLRVAGPRRAAALLV